VRIFNAVDSIARERAMIEEMTKARERERSFAPMVVFFSLVESGWPWLVVAGTSRRWFAVVVMVLVCVCLLEEVSVTTEEFEKMRPRRSQQWQVSVIVGLQLLLLFGLTRVPALEMSTIAIGDLMYWAFAIVTVTIGKK
jgi:hypothetical protein